MLRGNYIIILLLLLLMIVVVNCLNIMYQLHQIHQIHQPAALKPATKTSAYFSHLALALCGLSHPRNYGEPRGPNVYLAPKS